MITSRYGQRFLPGHVDDVSALWALVSSGLFDCYVTYEQRGKRYFAGNVLGEVTLNAERIVAHLDGRLLIVSVGPHPLRELGDLLRSWGAQDWRAYGYLAFELGRLIFGTRPAVRHPRPLAHLIVPETEVQWSAAGTTIRSASRAALNQVAEILQAPQELPQLRATPVDLGASCRATPFHGAVAEAVRTIVEGRLRKVIISRRVEVPFQLEMLSSYVLGLSKNAPARSFLLDLRGRRLAGFSPEILAEVHADGQVVTQPLAGTRPIVLGSMEDQRLCEELLWDVKECYEHVISARLAYQELLSICSRNSVAVRDLMTVKERGTVRHLSSLVTGQLMEGRDAWDAMEALFPAVTASGIPKASALALIGEIEQRERGLYAGAVCVVDSGGGLDAALTLRSVFQEGRTTWLQAGAGVVSRSEPEREYEETTNKLRSVAECLVAASSPEGAADDGGWQQLTGAGR